MPVNYKNLTGAGIISAALIAIAFFTLPLYNSIKPVKEEIAFRQSIYDQKKDFIDKVETLKKQAEAREDDLAKLDVMLPIEKKVQDILVNMETLPNEAALLLETLGIGMSEDNQADIQKIGINVATKSSYRSLVNFIKLLERNLRIFDVQKFTITPASKESQSSSNESEDELGLDVDLVTYFLNPLSVSPAANQPSRGGAGEEF